MSKGELVLYRTEDGLAEVQLRAVAGTVWLTQMEMAELFDTTKPNISMHIKNIFESGELSQNSVVKKLLTTAPDGKSYNTIKDRELGKNSGCRNFRRTADDGKNHRKGMKNGE